MYKEFFNFLSSFFINDMEADNTLCVVRAAELFPKPQLEKEDGIAKIPFTELAGESVKYIGHTDDGILALSNYRIFLSKSSTNSETSVPLGLIESALARDIFHLIISCKDASTIKCSFGTSEQCSEWQRRISLSVGIPSNLESLFAFPFYAWLSEFMSNNSVDIEWKNRLQRASKSDSDFRKEVDRLEFDLKGTWRISNVNEDFKLCSSYPRLLLVPHFISDETLQNIATFRSSRRIPAIVWRHKASGAVIARCSQPEVGWLGWRNSKDEQFLKALAEACANDGAPKSRQHLVSASSEGSDCSHEEVSLDELKKVLIVDARSYTSAVTNRARGGGCECAEYYPSAEIQFMNLGNIHAIRKSFHAIRQLCASPADVPNWLALLEKTLWLQHLSGLLAASMTICHAVEKNGRPILVHCSDGWDRTPQIVATAQLCLDPFYRTIEGFRILVEREWLSFGHKFADRCGHGPGSDELNERCPVFLQWLDCVHQIHRQYPCSFEFSMGYLIKLAQHSHSCLFGTFLCNTVKERIENSVFDRTYSVWPFLSGSMYKNELFLPNKERVLWPAHNVRDLVLWSDVYFGSLGNQNTSECPPNSNDNELEPKTLLIKTRSHGDLITIGGQNGSLVRRSSDPNMTGVDSHYGQTLSQSSLNGDLIDSETLSDTGVLNDIDEQQIMNTNNKEIDSKLEEFQRKSDNVTNEFLFNLNNLSLDRRQQEKLMFKPMPPNIDTTITDNHAMLLNDHKINNNDKTITTDLLNNCHDINYFNNNNNNNINYINCSDNEKQLGYIPDSSPSSYTHLRNHNINSLFETNLENGFVNHNYNNPLLIETSDNIVNNHVNNNQYTMTSIPKINQIENNLMLQSIDLDDSSQNCSPVQDFWHGNIETSTDTLVPIEQNNIHDINNIQSDVNNVLVSDVVDGSNSINDNHMESKKLTELPNQILSVVTQHNNVSNNSNNLVKNNIYQTNNIMDESIIIQPEYEKMDILNDNNVILSQHRKRRNSSNSKQDPTATSPNKGLLNGSMSPTILNSKFSIPSSSVKSLPLSPPSGLLPTGGIVCPDGLTHALSEQNLRLQQIVYEHKRREQELIFKLEKAQYSLRTNLCSNCINCQQNMTEEPEDEINDDFRFKIYSDCSSISSSVWRCFDHSKNYYPLNSLGDNAENSSVCSWEAVEDRTSNPSSGASSTQPMVTNVLWVPDHAVSKCSDCQIEFTVYKRKHHCRSCGKIFCGECSGFKAPLPEERLYDPVRLCSFCYQNVTARIHLYQQNRPINLQSLNQQQNNQQPQIHQLLSQQNLRLLQNHNNNNSNSNSNALEHCKQAVGNVTNKDRDGSSTKVTTATN